MKQSIAVFGLIIISLASYTVSFGQKNRQLEVKTVRSHAPTVEVAASRPQASVVFGSAEAFTTGSGVYIRWSTSRETDNVGFYVIRISSGKREFVDNRFIAGSAIKSRHETLYDQQYDLYDANGTAQSQYVVESFQVNGERTSTQPISPSHVTDFSSIKDLSSENSVLVKQQSNSLIASDGLVYSEDIQSVVDSNVQLADPVSQRWVAAQPGAKIGVRQTGMYRVTKDQLAAAGFDVNSDFNLWQLFTDGVEQSIIVGPSGNYIDFYGKGIDTVESDTRIYYLVVGAQPGRRIASAPIRANASTTYAPSYDASVSVKERQNYIIDLLNGDTGNYFGHLINNSSTSISVNLTMVDPAAVDAHVTVNVLGYSPTSHTYSASLNGHPIGQFTGANVQAMTLDVSIPASYLVEGVNALSLVSSGSSDYGFFDQVQITYKRRYVAGGNLISFTTQKTRKTNLSGFSSGNIRLFDVTYDGRPILMTGALITSSAGGFGVDIPASRTSSMYAVDDSALLSPFFVTYNNPSSLSTSNHNANLVIISYKDFMTQANTWADYRRGQGISVEVVNVEDVFDEFNYGVLSANSLRDFLNFARQTWQTPPQYVLLIGDGTYDPRNYEGNGYWDLIPAKLFDSDYGEAPSDDAVVDFNNDGLAEMAIGRIPAKDAGMVTNALNKTMSFEANIAPQNLARGFVCNYDNAGLGWDFLGTCQHMVDQLPSGTTSVLVPRADTSPNATLINEMNNGRYFVNFAGHGTTGSWASSQNFNIGNVSLLTNLNGLSVFTMLTCLNGYFIGPNSSMAEVLLNSTAGGAAAAWASTGETTPDIQETMGVRFYSQVAAGQIPRLGDLILDAKSVVSGGRDVRLTWALIGDPMLKVR